MLRKVWIYMVLGVLGPELAAAQAVTHVNQHPYMLVSLRRTADLNSPCGDSSSFYRVWASGVRAKEPFTVPSDKYLVVTDYSWSAVHSSGYAPFQAGGIAYGWFLGWNGTEFSDLHRTPGVNIPSGAAAPSYVAGNNNMSTGFRVKGGMSLCFKAYSQPGIQSENGASAVELQGYLIGVN